MMGRTEGGGGGFDCYIREFQSNSNVLYLINCGNKSKCFCVFYKFYCSLTTQSTSKLYKFSHKSIPIPAAYAAQYELPSSFTNSFTAKVVPHMLSSVLTDAVQMLPSAVNSHTGSNKYQYMFVKSFI